MIKKILIKNTGFSLVETLFAIAILMIALVGPMTLAWSSLSASNDQRNEVTAGYLAQESLEQVKNMQNRGVLQGHSFTSFLGDCAGEQECDIRPVDGDIVACSGANGFCPIYRVTRASDSWYTSNGRENSDRTVVPTGFKRKTVIAKQDLKDNEYKVTVTVGWQNRGLSRELTITELLYDY